MIPLIMRCSKGTQKLHLSKKLLGLFRQKGPKIKRLLHNVAKLGICFVGLYAVDKDCDNAHPIKRLLHNVPKYLI